MAQKHTLVNWQRTDKNSLEPVIHYENLDEHISLMHCLVCRRYARYGESCWGLVSIVPLYYLICCACSHSLQRTSVPFSVWPQRHIEHCLKYSNWDTEPHSPNKRRYKDKGITGLNPEMNILLDIHNSVSISSQKMVRPWRKKHALSHEFFLFLLFSSAHFRTSPLLRHTIDGALHPVVEIRNRISLWILFALDACCMVELNQWTNVLMFCCYYCEFFHNFLQGKTQEQSQVHSS